jgi:hypothetical protein
VSELPAPAVAHSLPARPSLEHLRKQARVRLRNLRATSPGARLADAQLQIAREHGFASWRALKDHVDAAYPRPERGASRLAGLAGFYRHQPPLPANAVVRVICADDRLSLEMPSGARLPLREQGNGHFAVEGTDHSYSFERRGAGPAQAMTMHLRQCDLPLPRIGADEADEARQERDASQAEQLRPRREVAVPVAVLEQYVGDYALETGIAISLRLQQDRLMAQVSGQPSLEVTPESETKFFYRVLPAQLEIRIADGAVAGLVLHQHGSQQYLKRVSADELDRLTRTLRQRLAEQQRPRVPVGIDPALLPLYAGRYRLDATRILTVSADAGHLYFQAPNQPRVEIFPESERCFFFTVAAVQISFVLGEDGGVTHAVLHESGRDIPVARIGAAEAQP